MKWHGSPNIPFSDYEFQRFASFLASDLDTAIVNLNKTISAKIILEMVVVRITSIWGFTIPSEHANINSKILDILV